MRSPIADADRFPFSNGAADRVISLPMSADITETSQQLVVGFIGPGACSGIIHDGLSKAKVAQVSLMTAQRTYWRDIRWQASGNALAQLVGIPGMPLLTRLYMPADFATQSLFAQGCDVSCRAGDDAAGILHPATR